MRKGGRCSSREMEIMLKSIQINNPGIGNELIEAFRVCDRAFFTKVDPYLDEASHIAHGQTISQPSTIARMIRLLGLEQGMDVLEVGANTGYHAALVAYLVYPGSVTTIEIFPDLAEMARKNVKALVKHLEKINKKEAKKFEKIEIVTGDALDKTTRIWRGKYDRIYFTAGVDPDKVDDVKRMGEALLKDKGLLLYPTRESWDYGGLELWQMKDRKLSMVSKEMGYTFVPLLKKEDLEELYEKKRSSEKRMREGKIKKRK
ncbi:MAG: hypothetical protein K6T16_03160 [Candidatus Pacearchaeota archaeon]|nr:hypothetical protein [Candidatus Pacearchaeota archaeon]